MELEHASENCRAERRVNHRNRLVCDDHARPDQREAFDAIFATYWPPVRAMTGDAADGPSEGAPGFQQAPTDPSGEATDAQAEGARTLVGGMPPTGDDARDESSTDSRQTSCTVVQSRSAISAPSAG